MLTAVEARQNPFGDMVIHQEARDIETAILKAVRIGLYNVLVNNCTPMTYHTSNVLEVATLDSVNSTLIVPNHGLTTGDIVTLITSNGLPSPLLTDTFYYVIYQDLNTIKLALTRTDALSLNPINITFGNSVSNIVLNEQGTGYFYAPSVTFVGGNATTSATATSILGYYGGVAKISVSDPGNGYTDVPSAEIISVGSSAISGTVTFLTVAAIINNGGSNYRVGDVLTVTGGTGISTTITVSSINTNGTILTCMIVNPGAYISLPTLVNVTTTVSPVGGTGATVNLNIGIKSIAVATGGLNYQAAPLISISGGGGSGATAQAQVSAGSVYNIIITAYGSGYTNSPTIDISSGNGAVAQVVLQPTGLESANIIFNDGTLYTIPPTVDIIANGSGATIGTVYMQIVKACLVNPGSNYQIGDVLLISGGGGLSNASITVLSVGQIGQIVTYTLISSGQYTSLPELSYNLVNGGSGRSAAFELFAGLLSITLVSGGSGYTSPPVVIVENGNAEVFALTSNAIVSNLIVTHAGYNFSTVANIVIDSGHGATAYANLLPTQVANVSIIDSGTGYNYATVIIDGNATATATISGGNLTDIVLDSGGSGYTNVPNVTIIGDGTNATAYATLVPSLLGNIVITNNGVNYTSVPNITVGSNTVILGSLQVTGVSSIIMIDSGSGYTSVPTVEIIPNINQLGSVISPTTIVSIGYSVTGITITNSGNNYQTVPSIVISPPNVIGSVQATATATIGYGSGPFSISKYTSSYDYFAAWQGTSISDAALIRPYQDQMNTVINYFTNLGYTINRQINTNTNNTLQWSVMW
jgi:hypothetical protein